MVVFGSRDLSALFLAFVETENFSPRFRWSFYRIFYCLCLWFLKLEKFFNLILVLFLYKYLMNQKGRKMMKGDFKMFLMMIRKMHQSIDQREGEKSNRANRNYSGKFWKKIMRHF